MKRLVALIMTAIIITLPLTGYAQRGSAGFEGGIHKNESDFSKSKLYKEMIYITGKPTLLQGEIETKIKDKSITYKYQLYNEDRTIKLTRSLDLERQLNPSADNRQVVEVNNMKKYKETIDVTEGSNKTKYELQDYQFHNSTLDDNLPIVTFSQGNWQGKKTYNINKTEGLVTVGLTGNIYGYDHYWGGTETQKVRHDISYTRGTGKDAVSWYGSADMDVSFNRTKRMDYSDNIPNQSSFDGAYTLTERDETILKYSYDLPHFTSSGKLHDTYRNRGDGKEYYETVPTQQKMFIPRYQDIKGHWGEWDIKKLVGIQAIDETKQYFGPNLPTKRSEFAKWLVKSMDLKDEKEGSTRKATKKKDDKQDLFVDVSKKSPDYDYIKAIKDRGIMYGVGDNRFLPDGKITRAEVIAIGIRSLGLERLAPNYNFKTPFKDDYNIPVWAKKSVYVANQIGLAKGTPEGYIYPNEVMTRAEAAAFINRMIKHIQEDLKYDYREGIIR
ncbi:S-layer domain-containing protein [Gottschalkia purinilytica]|uniref:S-layer domain-containing protein n=1 Tax=Gottschalkia purinilytica TaxID=1503 RepID=A0A0L0WE62_GOTPU|nr:S-layer homology domain-containing protein [Gottschalkia purinilytica]KNF09768.1 S-layer domain-containing protein [Gottschalkia purinilytica]